jgi:hypothetical protein
MAAIWFDQVDNVRWSPLMIENIIEEIGYEMSSRIKVHYSVPHLWQLAVVDSEKKQVRQALR